MRRHLAVLLLALFYAAPLLAAEDVHEYMLDNGLKLIVKQDRRAPVVVSQVWYRIGSSYEYGGITGVSHVLEHMMFKGTDKLKPGEFSEIIAENGGRENAFTGRDYTAYFQTMASDRLEVSFRLESDRMRNIKLELDEFQKEVEVVKEERRLRTEDKPIALVQEQFNAEAFTSSPYRQPVIGWMNDLDNMEIEDLAAWYRQWYAPNNATVVVAGDVDPAEVYKLAKQYFGPLQPEKIRPPKPQREPAQLGERRITVRAPAKQDYLIMGYKVPTLGNDASSWEPYALEVLASVLDGGDSARFSREIVRDKRLAASVGADYSAYQRLSGLFRLDAIAANDYSLEDVEKELYSQITRVQSELVTDEELERVRAAIIAGEVYEKDSVFYQAMQIGMLETMGFDWRLGEEHADRINAVTAEQVREVARKYLVADNLTVAILDPQPMESGVPRSGSSANSSTHAH